MKRTAARQRVMPMTMRGVMGSRKSSVPMSMAVMGSNTPRIAVRVGPMIRVAMARVSREIMVGNMARPVRLSADFQVLTPFINGTWLVY